MILRAIYRKTQRIRPFRPFSDFTARLTSATGWQNPGMVWRTRQQPPIVTGSSWLPPAVIAESLADREARLKREEADRQAMEEIYARQWEADMLDIKREAKMKARPRRQSENPPAERSYSKGSYARRSTETAVSPTRERFEHERSTARIVGKACGAWLIQRGHRLDEFSWQRAQEAWKTATGYHTADDSKPVTGTLRGSNGHASDDGTTPIKESLT
jgi:hypothetical protein